MCPACITSAVIFVASTGSAGAAAAVLHKKLAALCGADAKSGQTIARVSSQTTKENENGPEGGNAGMQIESPASGSGFC